MLHGMKKCFVNTKNCKTFVAVILIQSFYLKD